MYLISNWRRIFILIGIILLLSPNVFSEDFEDGNFKFSTLSTSGECQINGIRDGYTPTGDLIIPSTASFNGTSLTVIQIYRKAFNNCTEFTGQLVIPDGVKQIGSHAFNGCSGLTGELKIPESVTSIGSYAFNGCSGFTGPLTIPEGVTSIGDYAFNRCSGFTGSLNIPKGITSIKDGTFSSCSGFTGSLNIPKGVTSIGESAFYNCRGFTGSLIIPDGVTSIEYWAFYGCSGFTGSLTIPETVTSIGNCAFEDCSGFTGSLTIPDKVTSIGNSAFYNCNKLGGILTLGSGLESLGTTPFDRCKFDVINSLNPIPPKSIEEGKEANVFTAANKQAVLSVPAGSEDAYAASEMWSGFKQADIEATGVILDRSNWSTQQIGATVTLIATITPDNATDKSVTWASSDATIASVDASGKVTALAVGTANITATTSNGKTATCTVEVMPVEAESVTLSQTEAAMTVGENITLTATVAPATTTDKTVTWSSSDETIASVDASGKVTALAVGTANITATTSNGKIATCTVEVMPVEAESVTLSQTEAAMTVGENITLTATVAPATTTDKTVTWASSDATIASVDASGKVTALAVGTATITATTTNGKTATCAVEVKPIEAESITLSQTEAAMTVGDNITLTATVTPDTTTDKTVTWSSSAPTITSVDASGKVTALAVGTANITATTSNGKTATCAVEVKPIEAESVTLSQTEATITVGDNITLTATIAPATTTDKTVTWSSSDETIASVDADGKVTALKAGSTIITATTVNGKSATCAVTVKAKTVAATGIALDQTTAELTEGESLSLTATVSPANATSKTVGWTSSNTAVATVDATGEVIAISEGTATITASTTNGLKATCVITVKAAIVDATGITLSKTALTLTTGGTAQLTATIAPDNTTDQTITWTTSKPTVATVDASGVVKAVRSESEGAVITVGTATITATTANGLKATCRVTVRPRTATVNGIEHRITYADEGGGQTFAAVTGGVVYNEGYVTIVEELLVENGNNDITVPITSVEPQAFVGRTDITKVLIPKSVTFLGNEAFANCSGLKEIVIEDASTMLGCGTDVFKGSPFVSLYLGRHTYGTIYSQHQSLDHLEIGELVDVIDENEFRGCDPITDLTVYATNPPLLPDNGFDESVYQNTYLRVPQESVEAYKEADGWKKFNHDDHVISLDAIPAENITLDVTELPLILGTSKQLRATITPENVTNKTLRWSSSDAGVASVTATGLVVGRKIGTAIISVRTTNNLTATCTVTVAPKLPESIEIEPAEASITEKTSVHLSANITPEDVTDPTVTWSSSDESVATVDEDGLVSGLIPGTVTITATTVNGFTATSTVKVVAAVIPVKTITLTRTKVDIELGRSITLRPNISPTNATDKTVTWTSSDEKVAAVNASGVVTTLSLGTATISVTTVNGLSATCAVTVVPRTETIGGLIYEIIPGGGENGEDVVKVIGGDSDDNGVIRIPVEVEIDGKKYPVTEIAAGAFKDRTDITKVIIPPTVVTIGDEAFSGCTNLSDVEAEDGEKVLSCGTDVFKDCPIEKLYLGRDTSGKPFAGNPLLESVTIGDKVTSIGSGDFSGCTSIDNITVLATNPPALPDDGFEQNVYKRAVLRVPDSNVSDYKAADGWKNFFDILGINEIRPIDIELELVDMELVEGKSVTLKVIITPENATDKTVTWTSSDATVASVNTSGLITALKSGTATITAATINGLSATCTVAVVPRTETIGGIIYEIITGGGENGEDVVKVIGGNPDDSGTLTIPDEIEIDGKKYPVTEIAEGAFKDRTDIKRVVIPASVVTIGNKAFSGCTNLVEVIAEDGSKTLNCGTDAFKGAPISTLYLGRDTTGKPFAGNSGLKNLTIGDKVTSIGSGDFSGCTSIDNITVLATNPPALPDDGFEQDIYKNAVLRVPDSNVSDYKAADGWKNFFDILGINEIRPVGIALEINKMELIEGQTATLIAIITPENVTDKTVTWTSSDVDVATVDANGLVTAIKPGTATITATTSNGLKATCAITVEAKVVEASGIELNLEEAEVIENNTLQLTVTIVPADATDKTITWTSSNEAVATVDANGLVTAIKPGTATITATTSNGLKATCAITVEAKVVEASGIELNLEEAEVIENNTLQLTATVTPADATDKTITWASSNEAVATVNATGLVRAIKPGTATITATTSNNLTATCAVTVVAKPSGIEGVDGDDAPGVRVEGGEIIVDGRAEVFSITGSRVAVSDGGRISGLPHGIYIVRSNGKTVKIKL